MVFAIGASLGVLSGDGPTGLGVFAVFGGGGLLGSSFMIIGLAAWPVYRVIKGILYLGNNQPMYYS